VSTVVRFRVIGCRIPSGYAMVLAAVRQLDFRG
jgi:hypothetical protein